MAAVTGWHRPAKTSRKKPCGAWLHGAGRFVLDLNWGCARVRLHDASPGQRPLTGSDFVRCD